MQTTVLSREITNLYKGIGILLIVLHNFYHNTLPRIGENEFAFNTRVTERFIEAIISSPTEWFRAVFSYFGHYGVQIFILLSAYGLTRRYANTSIQYASFLKARFGKIYISFVICFAIYIILGLIKSAFLTDEQVLYWDSLLWKLLLISNFVPGQAMMPVGPWWFIPFIMQFYLIYPVLLVAYQRIGVTFLYAIGVTAILAEWAINPILIKSGINLNFSPIGHLPVLCLGMYLATRSQINISVSMIIGILILFILGCLNEAAWILTDICAVILLLYSCFWLFEKLSGAGLACRVISFYGTISFHLFMVNGFLRTPFYSMSVSVDKWWFTIACGIFSLVFSTACAVAIKWLDEKLRDVISQRRSRC